MTRCTECSTIAGREVDHTTEFLLPPLLVRFEHFLATRGILGEPQGAIDKDLPTRGKRVPSNEMSLKHRRTCVGALVSALTEIGYLRKAEESRRWVFPPHPEIRDLSARQIQDYLMRRFPRDPCRTHGAKCVRCCLPHHLSMYNKVTEAFRKMAEWLYFSEKFRDGPVWSKEKLLDVYAVARARRYKRGVHEINPVEHALAFQAWLEREAVPPRRGPTENHSGERHNLYEQARALFESRHNAKEIAKRLGLPYSTAYSWCVTGRGRSGTYEAIRAEMPKVYAYSLWWIQETGSRYEEMAHAEFPLEGPFVTLNRRAGLLTIVGKGREGGKTRMITLTKDQAAKVEEILRWRAKLGKIVKEHAGRDPEPALFLTLHDSPAKCGHRLAESAGPWDSTLRAWARRYNAWCDSSGRSEAKVDVALVTSHRIGRAVSITKLVKEGVAEKVIMLERGIEDHRTLEGYIHTTSEERREILERAERSRAARVTPAGPGPANGENGSGGEMSRLLEELRGLRRTVDELRAEVRDRDARIRELTDRLLETRAVPAR